MTEFIDAEEVDESDYDCDEGSVIMNFQHLQLKWETDNVNHDTMKQKEEECMITRSWAWLRQGQASGKYSDTYILLDNGSTCLVIKNEDIVIDIVKSETIMRAITNGGHQDSDHKGILPGFFKVWINKRSLLNILAMGGVRKNFRVTMDTDVEVAINVHMKNWQTLKFKEIESGLYMFYLIIKDKHIKSKVREYSVLTLVSANKSNFTRHEIQMTDSARDLYRRMDGQDTRST